MLFSVPICVTGQVLLFVEADSAQEAEDVAATKAENLNYGVLDAVEWREKSAKLIGC